MPSIIPNLALSYILALSWPSISLSFSSDPVDPILSHESSILTTLSLTSGLKSLLRLQLFSCDHLEDLWI